MCAVAQRGPETFLNWRLNVLLLAMLAWAGVIVVRLAELQIVRQEELQERVENLHQTFEEIPAKRGEILDANGKTLAISHAEPFLFADPSVVENPREIVDALSAILKQDRKWHDRRLQRLSNRERRFCYLAKRLTLQEAEEIEALIESKGWKGLYLDDEIWRKYPKQWLASHVLGFVNSDMTVKEGLELFYDASMRGTPGKREVLRDGKQRRIDINPKVIKEPIIGSNLQLTLDENIQFFVEQALQRGMDTTGASHITAIVVDPRDGAVLAMANAPDFDPNRYGRNPDRLKNRALVDVYEPASAFKIVTVASALDQGIINLADQYDCERGGIRVADRYVRDWKPFGTLSVREILWHSSNVGTIKIAQQMKPEVFHDYIAKFGFGEKTGIDLPAESAGIFHPLNEWSAVSPSFLSMGYEISVTPLQMLMAAAVVANDGLRVEPYVVTRVIAPDGTVEDMRPTKPPERVISSRTARLMAETLRGVVDEGTASKAQIPGVSVFGKTGTARRISKQGYSRSKYNASFVGFFPTEAPRYGIIVVVQNPKGKKIHGGDVAAPIFSEIGRQIVLYEQSRDFKRELRLFESTPDWPSNTADVAVSDNIMPNLEGLGLRNVLYLCGRLGIKPVFTGSGRVMSQWPFPGEPIPEDRICKVEMARGAP